VNAHQCCCCSLSLGFHPDSTPSYLTPRHVMLHHAGAGASRRSEGGQIRPGCWLALRRKPESLCGGRNVRVHEGLYGLFTAPYSGLG